jgi:hypothetical protein
MNADRTRKDRWPTRTKGGDNPRDNPYDHARRLDRTGEAGVTQISQGGARPASLMPLITVFTVSRLIYFAAELGLADKLAPGEKSVGALAAETGTHAPSLYRMLRALAAFGVFEEARTHKFRLTPLGEQLRSDIPGSVRNFARFFAGQRSWMCFGDVAHSIQTGETAMRHVYGVGTFDHLASHPEEADIFNQAMADATRQIGAAAAATYDFSAFGSIMDVGGGNGTLIAELLRATPDAKGAIFDLPAAAADAPKVVTEAGVAARCRILTGDFFKSVPAGFDAITLKSVIHDWDDPHAISILRSCRAAASANTRLLLIERVMPEIMTISLANQQAAILDIRMLLMPGGRGRTEQEYRELLAAAGFAWTRNIVLPDPIDFVIIEARPRRIVLLPLLAHLCRPARCTKWVG